MPKKIYVDVARCVGCRTCEIACALAHATAQSLAEALQEGAQSCLFISHAEGQAVPLQCRHCAEAPCVAVCPKSALTQEEGGLVQPHPELCVACRSCVLACPYGLVRLGGPEGKTLLKCDLCLSRQQAGQPPACVESCPTGAILWAEGGDWAAAYEEAEKAAAALETQAELPERQQEAAAADSEGARTPARVACALCGQPFATAGQIRAIAKKLGRQPAYLLVCPLCRREKLAAALICRLGSAKPA